MIGILISERPESNQEILENQGRQERQDGHGCPAAPASRPRWGTSGVFASPTTWYRLVRDHEWRRPRQRVHPAKPKVGIRASRPNEIWHVDTTLIRLLDGSRAFLHAVVDNFSRRIFAWNFAAKRKA